MFERLRKLREIDKSLRTLQQVNEFHLYQRDHFGRASGDIDFMNIHGARARAARIDIVRLQYEREMVRTGKSFWELHEIRPWIAQAPISRREGWPQSFETLPVDAFSELMEVVQKRRHAEFVREREADLRYRYDYSDADEVRAIQNRNQDYGTLKETVDKVRDKMFEDGDRGYLPSEVLVPIAYKYYKDNPQNPDIEEIIGSAKREMTTNPGYKSYNPEFNS